MSPSVAITSCYAFFPLPLEGLDALHDELTAFGMEKGMRGLVLIATEGLNATVCGSDGAIAEWKARVRLFKDDIAFKDSRADAPIFRRWSVKVKREIVALKRPDVRPEGEHRHLDPAEWEAMRASDDVVVIDTRNDYETALGIFRGAIDPGIRHFSEFPAFVRRSSLPKEKKILLYCTGGIRCEKAIVAMEEQGYDNVYQLRGGILAYLEHFPDGAFDGECFVFDKRVAVDRALRPSRVYRLCSGCGDPIAAEPCSRCPMLVTV